MTGPHESEQFVPDELFDEDYDHFYGDLLSGERAESEAELIRRLAGLNPGDDVLDVPCGDGRIAVHLARAGCNVIGVDLSERLIARARERESENLRFQVGDMRELSWHGRFDLVLNWFSSFGYYDSETNRRVLRAFRKALRPGGKLILEQRNPALLERAIELGGGTFTHTLSRGQDRMVDRVRIEDGRARIERLVVRDGRTRKIEFSLELLDGPTLQRWLRDAGFDAVKLYDGEGRPFGRKSERMLAVASPPREGH
jgi:SAM-dependent methyltransferase